MYSDSKLYQMPETRQSKISSNFIFDTTEELPRVDFSGRRQSVNVATIYKATKTRQYIHGSLNNDIIENTILVKKDEAKEYFRWAQPCFWILFTSIGIITATISAAVDLCVVYFTETKFEILYLVFEDYKDHYVMHLIFWIVSSVGPMFIGAFMVTNWEPVAAGSGISLVKANLNGIAEPRAFTFKTLVIKAVGLIFTMVSGVISGKEGPMIHIGAIVGSIVSRGRINFFNFKADIFKLFREDYQQRDFISVGAACGVSSAFGSNIGGVMFCLEEGSSFWNQSQTWRIFVTTIVSSYILQEMLRSHVEAKRSLITIGTKDTRYTVHEIPAFICMGILGGLSGALWNHMNKNIALLRKIFLRSNWLKILDPCTLAGICAVVGYLMLYLMPICRDSLDTNEIYNTHLYCGEQYNVIASTWMKTPQSALYELLTKPDDSYHLYELVGFTLVYFFLSVLIFGSSCANGIFVPSLLTGASCGRLLILTAKTWFPSLSHLNEGKYALLMAVAHLAGVVRMTISLYVIVMESNNSMKFSLPIISTLIAAKLTGDLFNEGIFSFVIRRKSYPFLSWDPPPLAHGILADEFMSADPYSMRMVEDVKYVMDVLTQTLHTGFAVVDAGYTSVTPRRFGKLRGNILRTQIVAMLMMKMFVETRNMWQNDAIYVACQDLYLQKPSIKSVNLSAAEKEYTLDFRQIMNNSPYSSLQTCTLPRVFRLFRTLGIRHLPIVNDSNEVVGIVTRQDLAIYKRVRHTCQFKKICKRRRRIY